MNRARLILGIAICQLGIWITVFGEWFGSNAKQQLRVMSKDQYDELND